MQQRTSCFTSLGIYFIVLCRLLNDLRHIVENFTMQVHLCDLSQKSVCSYKNQFSFENVQTTAKYFRHIKRVSAFFEQEPPHSLGEETRSLIIAAPGAATMNAARREPELSEAAGVCDNATCYSELELVCYSQGQHEKVNPKNLT